MSEKNVKYRDPSLPLQSKMHSLKVTGLISIRLTNDAVWELTLRSPGFQPHSIDWFT